MIMWVMQENNHLANGGIDRDINSHVGRTFSLNNSSR